ncbi:MAG: VOC family protein, partial [Solimonas sp.]
MAVIGGQRPGEFGLTLLVTDVPVAAQFYAEVLGAEEVRRHRAEGLRDVPDGTVTAAEMRLSGVMFMLSMQNPRFRDGKWIDARRPDWPRSPEAAGTTTTSFALYVDDVDATLAKALARGATLMHP